MDDRREKAVAFVVVRLTSSRLPAKQLRRIGGRSILERIMDALGEAAELDQVVLATVDEPAGRSCASTSCSDLAPVSGQIEPLPVGRGRRCGLSRLASPGQRPS